MEPLAILRADPLDLLFENRNKLYGAYPLRKYYRQRLFIALCITFSVVMLVCWFTYLHFQSLPGIIRPMSIPEVDLRSIILDPPPVKPVILPARPASAKSPATTVYTSPVIVDQQPPTPMATVDDLQKAVIGSKTVAGPPDDGNPGQSGSAAAGPTLQNDERADMKPEIFDHPERMPEFPGGIEALKRFLLKNLRMPENSLEDGEQVKVIARFVVGADGRVRDVEITQPAAAAFNMEVRRVISKMPDWKPGVQNHRNVSVYFSLPVNFVNGE
jgi:protein TonB